MREVVRSLMETNDTCDLHFTTLEVCNGLRDKVGSDADSLFELFISMRT